MMANHKQQHLLHELLKEDQEPFLLKNYIADRKYQLKRPSPKTQLPVKKHKPSQNFSKNACFFSFANPTCSPAPRKSPLLQSLHSPVTKSPCKSPNTIFLHIPARTAAILLEAALRIQKQSTTSKTKNSNTFGLFGSFLKRITSRNKPRKLENNVENIKKSVKDEEMMSRIGRNSSAVWSESNSGENKSLDLDTSSSSCDHDGCENLVAREFASFDQHEHFCDSPFHFVLRRSQSSGDRTPEFMLSPISSPSTTHHHHQFQGKENNNDVESLKKLQADQEEEDKEQCSPVSVLDPPFVDDDDGHDDPCEDDGFDLECSYAIVQKAKQQLLAKLRRFEKLAGLDPVELEKRILDQETNYEDNDESSEDDQLVPPHDVEVINKMIIDEIISKPRLYGLSRVPKDMKRLVSDLINEEQKEQNNIAYEDEAIVKRVCKRLESWKEVESNTIDMMVDQDFKKEHWDWKENQENVKETAAEIELAIFGLLVEELSEELIGFNRWY